jgi:hypothetical protein
VPGKGWYNLGLVRVARNLGFERVLDETIASCD